MRTRGILIQVKNPFLEPSCHDNTCLIKRAELTKISCRYRVSPGVAMFSLPPATRAIKKVKIACCFFAFPQGKNGKIQCACIKCFFPGGAALFFVTTRTVKTVKTFFLADWSKEAREAHIVKMAGRSGQSQEVDPEDRNLLEAVSLLDEKKGETSETWWTKVSMNWRKSQLAIVPAKSFRQKSLPFQKVNWLLRVRLCHMRQLPVLLLRMHPLQMNLPVKIFRKHMLGQHLRCPRNRKKEVHEFQHHLNFWNSCQRFQNLPQMDGERSKSDD